MNLRESFIETNAIELQSVSTNQPTLNDSLSKVQNQSTVSTNVKQNGPTDSSDGDYRSFWDFFRIAIILSLSSLIVGFSLAQVAIIPDKVMINAYSIPFGPSLTHALLMGILPLGGIFGLLLCYHLIKKMKKRKIYLLIQVMSLILTVLMQIQTFPTLLFGRFMLGVVTGMYPMLAPVMTRQIIPTSLLPIMGTFFSLGRTLGLVLCFAVGVIFQLNPTTDYYRVIFAIPGILSILQTITIHFFVPDPAAQLIARQEYGLLEKTIQKYYREDRVNQVIKSYIKTFEFQQSQTDQDQVKGKEKKQDNLKANKLRAFLMAIHINFFSNSCGVVTTFFLANSVMEQLVPSLSLYSNLIVNSARLPFLVFSTVWLVKKVGRRPLFLLSGILMVVCNFGMAFGYLTGSDDLILVFIVVFNIDFGLLYSPVMITYPAEIIPPSQYIIANVFSQISMMATLFIPPLVLSATGGDGFGLFLFFGAYCTLSLVYTFFYLKQSKGLKYEQIIVSY